jgi:excisionase family DNA binding protein
MRRKQYVMNWNEVPVVVDINYVVRLLQVSPETVRNALVSGHLPGFRVGEKGMWRINREDLIAYCSPSKGGEKEKALPDVR